MGRRPLSVLVVLAACLSSGAIVSRAAGHTSSDPVRAHAVRTGADARSAQLARAVAAPIPARNLFALANELKLRPPRTISHVARHTSPNYALGHEDHFRVLGEDDGHYFTMTATIRAKTAHLYIYVQNGVKVSPADVQRAAETFEQKTYGIDRSHFGSEWRPGVDGDPHITCLVGDLRSSGAAGFFSAEDEYPHLVNPYSNQREMIYINSSATLPGDGQFDLTLAHEFQHMIHWHMHPHDNAWLNEGMSMVAEYLNHHAPQAEAGGFVALPDTQLNSWTLDGPRVSAHYGAAYLFLTYLYSRYGKSIIRDLVADRQYTDFALVNDVLKKLNIHTSADKLFAQWVVANYLNDRSVAHGIYGYDQLPDRVTVQKTAGSVPFTFRSTVPPYAAQYVVINNLQHAKPFRLEFSAPSSVPVVATGGAPFWWSNKGDMSDTRMERSFDLTHVHQATLHFRTWYDIEKDYDYGYLEASTDGGKTWQTLRATHTTSSNPNGANYGNGFTGTTKSWRQSTADLTRFAGHHVSIRFQYVTDDEYNGQGMVISNLTIPEIGFRDSYTGWKLHGFVPVASNALPSRWSVQIIAYGTKHATVSSMSVTAGQGSLSVHPARQGIQKLVVVVYTAAPKTTATSAYTLRATAP